jgi:hypothetical protein
MREESDCFVREMELNDKVRLIKAINGLEGLLMQAVILGREGCGDKKTIKILRRGPRDPADVYRRRGDAAVQMEKRNRQEMKPEHQAPLVAPPGIGSRLLSSPIRSPDSDCK